MGKKDEGNFYKKIRRKHSKSEEGKIEKKRKVAFYKKLQRNTQKTRKETRSNGS